MSFGARQVDSSAPGPPVSPMTKLRVPERSDGWVLPSAHRGATLSTWTPEPTQAHEQPGAQQCPRTESSLPTQPQIKSLHPLNSVLSRYRPHFTDEVTEAQSWSARGSTGTTCRLCDSWINPFLKMSVSNWIFFSNSLVHKPRPQSQMVPGTRQVVNVSAEGGLDSPSVA